MSLVVRVSVARGRTVERASEKVGWRERENERERECDRDKGSVRRFK